MLSAMSQSLATLNSLHPLLCRTFGYPKYMVYVLATLQVSIFGWIQMLDNPSESICRTVLTILKGCYASHHQLVAHHIALFVCPSSIAIFHFSDCNFSDLFVYAILLVETRLLEGLCCCLLHFRPSPLSEVIILGFFAFSIAPMLSLLT